MSETSKMKICYVIEKARKEGGKDFWHRIGVAWPNSDGSLRVILQAFPVGGEMQIRDYVPREGGGAGPGGGGSTGRSSPPAGYAPATDPTDDIPF
jgi:hypothetical protein